MAVEPSMKFVPTVSFELDRYTVLVLSVPMHCRWNRHLVVHVYNNSVSFICFDDRSWKLSIDEQYASRVSIRCAVWNFCKIKSELSFCRRGLFIETLRQDIVLCIPFPRNWQFSGTQRIVGCCCRRMFKTKT